MKGIYNKSISVIVLTLNAKNTIEKIIKKIDFYKFKVIIIDSSSDDNTIEICAKYNCKIEVIKRSDFNHGATREYARKLSNSEIVVFMTHDAIPSNQEVIDKLIKPIKDRIVSVSYARQIPNKRSGILESFPRMYNYNNISHIRSIKDKEKYGVYTFFCSNSCAAWSNSALDEIGGFKNTLTNEDYFACAELLINGYKVAYVSEAVVTHSHKYTLLQEFQRMFDTGYVRAEKPWIQDGVGHASKRGSEYFRALIKKLTIEKPYLIPYAFVHTAIKYLGYKAGYYSINFPSWFKKLCSEQKYYWNSKYYNG